MSFLKQHIKKRERYTCKYFTVFNPTKKQEEELKEMMETSMKTEEDENGEIKVVGTFTVPIIKWIITELTNIEDDFSEISDEEFADLIEQGDEVVEDLMYQVEDILKYIGNKIIREQQNLLEMVEQSIDLFALGGQLDNSKNKVANLFKKKGIDLPPEECLKLLGNPEELKKVLDEAEKKKKKTTRRTTKKKS